jgi:uncharacterized membrane protein
MELWLVFSLLSMGANAAKVLIVKRLCGGIDSRLIVLVGRAFSALVLMPILLMQGRSVPTIGLFWGATIGAAVLTAFSSVVYTEAIKKGPLALVIPVQASVPVFTLLTLWLAHSETPASGAIVLMLLSMAAIAWMLYANYRHEDTGCRKTYFAVLSLIAAILFGVSTVLDRVAIAHAAYGALAFSAIWNLLSAILLGAECARARMGRVVVALGREDIVPLVLQYSLAIPGALTVWLLPGAACEG